VRYLIAVAAVFTLLAVTSQAQKPVTQGAAVTESFVIDAIDHSARLVTLRGEDGLTETIFCGPEVERFDALKVGDKVNFRYYESVVYQIRKPGAPVPKPSEGAAMVRAAGDKPGGTISQQVTAVVTVNEVDAKVPSVTVTTTEGRKMSFKVEDPNNIKDVKVNDTVEITYTQALAISVLPGK
jgi:hypothetical protein